MQTDELWLYNVTYKYVSQKRFTLKICTKNLPKKFALKFKEKIYTENVHKKFIEKICTNNLHKKM